MTGKLQERKCTMQFKYPQFEDSFRHMLKDAENSADLTKSSSQSGSQAKVVQPKLACCYFAALRMDQPLDHVDKQIVCSRYTIGNKATGE